MIKKILKIFKKKSHKKANQDIYCAANQIDVTVLAKQMGWNPPRLEDNNSIKRGK